jgi:hypothetical protein
VTALLRALGRLLEQDLGHFTGTSHHCYRAVMETPIDWPSAAFAWTEHGYELTVPFTAPLAAGIEPRLRHDFDNELDERLQDFHGLHHALEPAEPEHLVLRAPHLFALPAAQIRVAVDAALAAALQRHAERVEQETSQAAPWLAALRSP